MDTNTLEHRLGLLVHLPKEAYERAQDVFASLEDGQKERFVETMEEFDAQYAARLEQTGQYIANQAYLLTEVEHAVNKLEQEKDERSQDEDDQGEIESLLSQLS